jgi:hypothetical protein
MVTSRVFLLSPANCGGARARQVLSPRAEFPLARRVQSSEGAPLGDLYAFISGLYFRGKLTYARRFAAPPEPDHVTIGSGVQIITPNAGLRAPDLLVTAADIRAFAEADVHPNNPIFTVPLERSARVLNRELGPDCDVVLLGSIASPKYVDVLLAVFGERLRFPLDFVGRGDMSRGGLLLRKAAEGAELEYVPVLGATRHGVRPPRLEKLHGGKR